MLQGILGTLRPAVVALIGSAGVLILISAFWGSAQQITFDQTKWSMVMIFLICFWLIWKKKKNPILVMVLAGVMNVVYQFLNENIIS